MKFGPFFNLEIISPVWSLLLTSSYGVTRCLSQPGTVYYKPAQYRRSYQYSNFGLSPLLQKVGKTNDVIQYHRYDIFHIWLYIYTGVVTSSNSVGLQSSASRLAKPISHSMVAGIMYLKIFDHILKILFGMFWLYIYKHHIPPDGTTAVALNEFLISESILESSLPQEEQVMREGISTSKVSASLLQGNMVPIIT